MTKRRGATRRYGPPAPFWERVRACRSVLRGHGVMINMKVDSKGVITDGSGKGSLICFCELHGRDL